MKFGESRRPYQAERTAAEPARVLPFWPQRWRVVFGKAHEPVWVPVKTGAGTRPALAHFVRSPAKALWASMLLKAPEIAPTVRMFPRGELPPRVRAALSFELPITGPWQACIRMSGGVRPALACVLATTASGEPLAFAKVATLPSADAIVHAEAAVLESVGAVSGLAGRVPRLLSAGKAANGRQYLVTSVAPTLRTSHNLGLAHIQFLARLAQTSEEVRPFGASPLRRRLSRALLRLEPCLERRTLITVRSAFDECAQALDGWEGPFVYAHGDFKPDNVRIGRDGLFVHDWAHARGGANPLADLLHFQLAPRTGWDAPLTTRALRRALRVAAHSATQIHPEWSWSSAVVSRLGLAYLVEVLVERCLERHCFDPADPLVRAYWVLIEKRAVWFPTRRPAFQRILRGIHY